MRNVSRKLQILTMTLIPANSNYDLNTRNEDNEVEYAFFHAYTCPVFPLYYPNKVYTQQ